MSNIALLAEKLRASEVGAVKKNPSSNQPDLVPTLVFPFLADRAVLSKCAYNFWTAEPIKIFLHDLCRDGEKEAILCTSQRGLNCEQNCSHTGVVNLELRAISDN